MGRIIYKGRRVSDIYLWVAIALFSELAVFDARLYIGVRRIDEPA